MKLYVNLYNLYDGKDFLYTGKVYKEGDKFFMEINGNKFDILSKNGMVKSRQGNTINLDSKGVEIFNGLMADLVGDNKT